MWHMGYLFRPASHFSIMLALVLCAAASVSGGIEESQYAGSIDSAPIHYNSGTPADVLARLVADVNAGRRKLPWDEQHGYLPAVLKALNIPVESQVLVYSKTSFQNSRISPATPRAIYFNDDVYVGWVQHGDVLEMAATDPQRGPVFYTLKQQYSSPEKLALGRNQQCLQCHVTNRTMGVPGPMVRSVYTHPSGFPILTADTFETTHRSPLEERWGGWYVSGTHGEQRHMGNFTVRNELEAFDADLDKGANVTDLTKFFDTSPYLSPHSDIVALMVLEHQCHMHNLLTRAAYETRQALMMQAAMDENTTQLNETSQRRIEQAGEAVLRYMLFADELYLSDPVVGTSGFAEKFQQAGPRDRQGRSLRELDMGKYLFRYPCSYMIYSDAFEALPGPMKDYLYRRLHEVLTGKNDEGFRISTAKRQAILEILRETKKDLPDYWRN